MENKPYLRSASAELNLIAKRLDSVKWLSGLSPIEQEHCDRLQSDPNAIRRHVSMLPDYRTWAVRLYLGGAQRTLGLMVGTGDGFSRLLRFADMAKMHFWKYGVRTAHVPGDMELNFSAERANEDLKCEVHALGLLHDIENHLIDTKALLPPTERELARKMARLTKPTITRAMTELNHSLQARLQEVIEKLTAIQAELAELKSRAWVASPPLDIRGSPADSPFPDFTHPSTTGDPLLPRPITICGTTHLSPGNV